MPERGQIAAHFDPSQEKSEARFQSREKSTHPQPSSEACLENWLEPLTASILGLRKAQQRDHSPGSHSTGRQPLFLETAALAVGFSRPVYRQAPGSSLWRLPLRARQQALGAGIQMRNCLVVGCDVIYRCSSGSPPRQARPVKLGSGGVCWGGGGALVLRREGVGRGQRGGPLLESAASWVRMGLPRPAGVLGFIRALGWAC